MSQNSKKKSDPLNSMSWDRWKPLSQVHSKEVSCVVSVFSHLIQKMLMKSEMKSSFHFFTWSENEVWLIASTLCKVNNFVKFWKICGYFFIKILSSVDPIRFALEWIQHFFLKLGNVSIHRSIVYTIINFLRKTFWIIWNILRNLVNHNGEIVEKLVGFTTVFWEKTKSLLINVILA